MSRLVAWVQRLRPGVETLIVLGCGVGPFVLLSVLWYYKRRGSLVIGVSDRQLLGTIGVEVILALVLLPLLAIRGWRLSDITVPATFRDVPRALGIWVVAYLAYALCWYAVRIVTPGLAMNVAQTSFAGDISSPVVALVVVLNPVFEELLFLGYIVRALERLGPVITYSTSLGLRALVHVYQGPLAVVAIVPMGLVYLYFYTKRRSIWPLIFAHAIADAVGLAFVKR